jgi:seryl-tRNA synthetase
MIDIQVLRKNPQEVAKRLATRGPGAFDLTTFERFEATRKELQAAVQQAQASRNRIAKDIGQAKAKGLDVTPLMQQGEKLKSLLEESEKQLERLQAGFQDLLERIPNIPHESVPLGKSSEDNPERRRWREPKKFEFPIKDHVEIGEALGGLDFASATKIAGSRFVLMKGEVARLHRALAQFMLDVHTREHGYTEIYTPYIVNSATAFGTGQLPKFEQDLFIVPRGEEKSYLIPTAEVPVTNIVRDEIVEASRLPLKFVSHTPCFRSEAGSYGKDTRGIWRVHWFDKVEMFSFCAPEDAAAEHRRLLQWEQEYFDKLEVPYRVIDVASGDLGASAARKYDIEVWIPTRNGYGEVTSTSNCTTFQARRLGIRLRDAGGVRPVATLNGTLVAVTRALVAILENHQQSDGSVRVPRALQPYLGREMLTPVGR